MPSSIHSKRTRGPNKRPPWSRDPGDGVSVIRLALDTSDPLHRGRVEAVFSTAYSLRRALQRDARSRVDAYWVAHRERARKGFPAVRERLGLSREALERAAYRHLERAPHLKAHATKALAMHLADSVWTGTERHLFRDNSGRFQGKPRVGRWHDFTRIPGRARSHTRRRKWETFRLHGTLSAHRMTYTGADGRFFQPRRMRPVERPGDSWWSHQGPLVVVFSGLVAGELMLPVKLPAAPSNQPYLDHHLSDLERWHKIDLVRHRDPGAAGGWRYEAHLMVLTTPYASEATKERRENAARETAARTAGIDVNVSNVTVASHEKGQGLRITCIRKDAGHRESARRRALQERRRHRALDRARRATNPDQYCLSRRQEERARRRAEQGLPQPAVSIPMGPRKSRTDGKPMQAYRRDRLSKRYRRERAAQVAHATSTARARRDYARRIAAGIVLKHGFRWVVEDCDLRAWARRWGRSIHAFAPGTILTAIRHEAGAVAEIAGVPGGVLRAGTRNTALSQHCLCGERTRKTLSERVHDCPRCALTGQRDAVSAVLAAHVVFTDPTAPVTAIVDYASARASLQHAVTWEALRNTLDSEDHPLGRQDAPPESTALTASAGSSGRQTGRTPSTRMVARRTVGTAPRPTPNETGPRGRTTPERAWTRTNLTRNGELKLTPLRDSS